MRIALALLLAIHGLVHLIGVVRPSPSGRALETLWFFATTLFVGAAVLVLFRSELWPAVVITGLLVSQGLIIERWREAKAGTVVNVALVAVAMAGFATARLRTRTNDEVRDLLARSDGETRIVRKEDVEPLPAPVRRWLERSGAVGAPSPRSVRIVQRGEMHTSAEAAWFPVEAVQHTTTREPGFVWWMDARMGKVLPLAGRDKLVDGAGEMKITLAGLFDIALGRGAKIDEGALQRWLAETIWTPAAALSPAVTWEAIDDRRATATVSARGLRAPVTFDFDDLGRVVAVHALRWYGADGPRQRWSARNLEWRQFDGIEVPVRGEVGWSLEGGDFTFYRWMVTEIFADPGTSTPRVDPAELGRFAGTHVRAP